MKPLCYSQTNNQSGMELLVWDCNVTSQWYGYVK